MQADADGQLQTLVAPDEPHTSPAPCLVQSLPHPPQLVLFEATDSSHPSSGPEAGIEQLAQPATQNESHTLDAQSTDATPCVLHARPHAPQFVTFAAVCASHPSANCESQFDHPALHAEMAQDPDEHSDVALGAEHTVEQVPQWSLLVFRFVSQPAAPVSQSPQPLSHVIVHTPVAHPGVPCALLHAVVHEPQCSTSPSTPASHPFAALLSQSANPVSQFSSQLPATHAAVACGFAVHSAPHPPQLDVLVSVLDSQPFASLPSQFAYPASQLARWQSPDVQIGVACANWHAKPHEPQLVGLVFVLVSHPFDVFPSQSPVPGAHVSVTHTPFLQLFCVPPSGLHEVGHEPQ